MINSISPNTISQNKRKTRKNLVSQTGYAAAGFGTICAITGLKQVKFAHKMKVHKLSAILAGIATVMHIGIIKGYNKIFQNKTIIESK